MKNVHEQIVKVIKDIDGVNEKIDNLKSHRRELREDLSSLQTQCEHEYIDSGGMFGSVIECKICGYILQYSW